MAAEQVRRGVLGESNFDPSAEGVARSGDRADPSIDELDVEICWLARHMNAKSYRMLVLVRDFDDRFGFAKWGYRNCAEWLAWRCGITFSAAREKVRTAQALRSLPAISAAFADGRLSYSKVRALTRVAAAHDEDLLLAYAIDVSASQVAEALPADLERRARIAAGREASVGTALAHVVPPRRTQHRPLRAPSVRRALRVRCELRRCAEGWAAPTCRSTP